jgi:hypothetical protein
MFKKLILADNKSITLFEEKLKNDILIFLIEEELGYSRNDLDLISIDEPLESLGMDSLDYKSAILNIAEEFALPAIEEDNTPLYEGNTGMTLKEFIDTIYELSRV